MSALLGIVSLLSLSLPGARHHGKFIADPPPHRVNQCLELGIMGRAYPDVLWVT